MPHRFSSHFLLDVLSSEGILMAKVRMVPILKFQIIPFLYIIIKLNFLLKNTISSNLFIKFEHCMLIIFLVRSTSLLTYLTYTLLYAFSQSKWSSLATQQYSFRYISFEDTDHRKAHYTILFLYLKFLQQNCLKNN